VALPPTIIFDATSKQRFVAVQTRARRALVRA
jgi:hypothetical protein